MKGKKKMCQQMAKLVKRKLRAEDKASPDIISLKYKEDATQEEAAPIEEPQLESKKDTIHEEVTETQGNEAQKKVSRPIP
jgi:hypothetical protein